MLKCYLLDQNNTKATIVDLADFVKETVNVSDIKKLLDTNRLVLLDRSEILSYTCINTLVYKILQSCKKDNLKDWLEDHSIPMCDCYSRGSYLGLHRLYDYSATLGKYLILLKYTDGLCILNLGLNTEYKIEFIKGNAEFPRVRSVSPCCSGYVHKNLFGDAGLIDKKVYLALEVSASQVIYKEVN